MRNLERVCCICFTACTKSKKVLAFRQSVRDDAREWYGVCSSCFDQYPEIEDMIIRVFIEGENRNHQMVFNLIDSIKDHRYGQRFIPPYKGKMKC